MKITGATTLAELAVELGKLGVERVTVDISTQFESHVIVMLWAARHSDARLEPTKGTGMTLPEAFDDGISRVTNTLGRRIAAPIASPHINAGLATLPALVTADEVKAFREDLRMLRDGDDE